MSSTQDPRSSTDSSSSSSPRAVGRKGLDLEVLDARFAICRLDPAAEIPDWALAGSFSSISRSAAEISIVCEQQAVPQGIDCQRGWRAIQVVGPLDFSLVGVLASLALPLAKARVSLFAVSTFDTDYILVRAKKLGRALRVLRDFGHRCEKPKKAPRKKPAQLAPLAPPKGRARHEKPEKPAWMGPLAPAPPEVEEVEEIPEVEPEEIPEEEPEEVPEEEPEEVPEEEPEEIPEVEAAPPRRSGREDVSSLGLYSGAIPQHPVETTDEPFTSLGLSDPILKTVAELGFEHPTPVQAAVIPEALAGHDVVGLAETGSGKTAAFALPLAERLTHGRGIRGLILCPTREIALQTSAFLEIFGRDHELKTVLVIGGVRMGPQIQGFRQDRDIIVATPGRLADHMRRGNVRLNRIEHLVLDEADHMLDLGFLPQIKEILEGVPDQRQTMMFSATMPPPIERLSKQFMKNPTLVDIRPEGRAAAGIEHRLYLVKDEESRRQCLFHLLKEVGGVTLVFARRKLHTEWLARQLENAGFPVARIHSDRSQGQRVDALRGFREGQHQILVATDVAARGIDVPGIHHVINFGLPETTEDYVHRAGRTARGAAIGIVSSIGTWQDKMMIRDIEADLGLKLPRCEVEGVEPYVELKRRRTVRRRRLL